MYWFQRIYVRIVAKVNIKVEVYQENQNKNQKYVIFIFIAENSLSGSNVKLELTIIYDNRFINNV